RVLPDAHRRRAVPAALGHSHRAPGRNTGGVMSARRTSSRGGAMSTDLGMPVVAPAGVGHLRGTQSFPDAARTALADTQLRRNLGHATTVIRDKRAAVVA